ncbi:MAG: diaminopimelate decarboxylase [Chloroflexi bacterium]|nr:diaminopimelate decarboxylase [Chloroflexota bacterium]
MKKTVIPDTSRLSLFPLSSNINEQGHLVIGGCDTLKLAQEFGTPLYVFDEFTLRTRCAEFKTEFGRRYDPVTVLYASKAFINRALALILEEEGMGLDVVSAGEMGIARAAGFPMERVFLHGNNKSAGELEMALELGIGRIVVDNFHEMSLLSDMARQKGKTPAILLRLSPGVDPHTHRYNTTGIIDSKFGFSLFAWEEAVTRAMKDPNLDLAGLHFHLGSLIFEVEPYREAIGVVLKFAEEMKRKHGFEMAELDTGGGFAVRYTVEDPVVPLSDYADVITSAVSGLCRELGLFLPRLIIEPGRAIVGQAGMALYRVGVVKDIPNVRRYVSVDGGMGDNIRHALYGAKHEAVVAGKAAEPNAGKVTIAGKYCESGDILITDIDLPPTCAGDVLAVADCGAYCLPMASNYNAAFKPAVVLVRDGQARLIRRRETLEDLTRYDV